MPNIGNLHIYNETPWLIVGHESVLKKSRPTSYVLGFSTDTNKIWVFDITSGWRQPKVDIGASLKHKILSEAHEDALPSDEIAAGDIIVAQNVVDKILWSRLSKPSSGTHVLTADNDGVSWKPNRYAVRINNSDPTVVQSRLNLIAGDNISLTISEDTSDNETDVTISATSSAHNLLDSTTHTDTNTASVTRGMLIVGQQVGFDTLWSGLSLGMSGTFLKSDGNDAIWDYVQWNDVQNKPNIFPVAVRYNYGADIGTRPRLNFIEGTNVTLNITDNSSDDEIDITINAVGTTSPHNLLDGNIHPDTENTSVERGMIITGQNVGGTNKWAGLALGSSGQVLKSNGTDAIWGAVDWSEIANRPSAFPVAVRRNSGANVGTRPRLNFIEGSNITIAVSDDNADNEIDITISSSGVGSHNLLNGTVHTDTNPTTVARGMIITGQIIGGIARWSGLSLGASGRVLKSDGSDAIWGQVDWSEVINKPSSFPITVRRNSGSNVGTRPRLNFIEGSGITLNISDDSTDNEVDITISSSGVSTHNLLQETVHTDTSNTTVTRGMIITGQLVGSSIRWKGLGLGSSGSVVKSNGTDAIWGQVDWVEIANRPTTFPVTVRKNSGTNVGTRPRLNFIEGSNISITVADDSTDNEIDITIAATGAGTHTLLNGSIHSDTNATTVTRGMVITGQLIGGVPRWSGLSLGTSGQVLKSNGSDAIWGQVDWGEIAGRPSSFPVTVRRNSGVNVGTRPRLNFIEGSRITISATDDSTDNEIDITIGTTATGPHNLLSSAEHPDTQTTTVARGMIITGQIIGGTPKWNGLSLGPSGYVLKSNGLDAGWGLVDWSEIANRPSAFPITVRKNSVLIVGTRPRLNFIEGSNITLTMADDNTDNEIDITISASTPSHTLLNGSSHTDTTNVTVARGMIITGQWVSSGIIKWSGLSLGANGQVLKSNGIDAIWGNVDWSEIQNKPTRFPVAVRANDGSVAGVRQRLNFIGSTGITVTANDDSGNEEVDILIKAEPFSESKASVQLNAAFNFSSTDQIIDAGSPNPTFQQVISTAGQWFFIITLETALRIGLSSGSSGTGQILISVYKREGTTDTFIRNIRVNYQTYFGSAGTSAPVTNFNSVQIWVPVEITYTGTSTDIRGNSVTGTVLFLMGRYTAGSNVTVSIAQAFSTSALDAVKFNKI